MSAWWFTLASLEHQAYDADKRGETDKLADLLARIRKVKDIMAKKGITNE